MSQRANPALIGTFVLAGTAACIAALIFFGSGLVFQRKETFLMYFSESVNGLDIGAPVKFKGVTIGRVKDIRIQYDQPLESDAIPVFVEIYTDTLKNRLGVTNLNLADSGQLQDQIRLGLRAKLEMQSYVTGLLYVEFDYYEDAPADFVQQSDYYPEIPTLSSNSQAIMTSVMQMLADINEVDFSGISNELKLSLRQLRGSLESVEFEQLGENIMRATEGLDKLVNAPELKQSLTNVESITEQVLEIADEIRSEFSPLSRQMRSALATVEDAMRELRQSVRPESSLRVQMESTLREFKRTAEALRVLADYLERHPNAVITGKPDSESP